MMDDEDGASFLDGLISPDTRRRTREQTAPLFNAICSPVCIRSTILTVGSALLILTTLLIAISLTHERPYSDYEAEMKQAVPAWMLNHATDDILRMHLQTLSSDLMEGRAPGTRGEALAAEYIASHFAVAGLKPAAENNSYFQPVPLASITPLSPPELVLGPITLTYPDQYTVSSDFFTSEDVTVIGADMIFVGHGIVAPQYNWNDYKDVSVADKIVVVLVNEPYDKANNAFFAGDTLTYYGRWTYKYEQARARGALGVVLVHTTETAGYGWQVVENSFAGEQVMLTDPPMTNPLHYKGWISEQAAEALAKVHNTTLANWMEAAKSREFTPIPLQTRFTLSVNYTVRHFTGTNVVARLGPAPKAGSETVVMMAHHDHLGIRPSSGTDDGDNIYNGAVDNASGVAALLAAARALGALYTTPLVTAEELHPAKLQKTIIFLSLTGEESNLLGATYFTTHSPCEEALCGATSALNFDIMNVWGPTHDMVAIGHGMSNYMDDLVNDAAKNESVEMTPDPTPNLGHLFRSDQLPFALHHVPSITFSAGTKYIGKPDDYYKNVTEAYVAEHYHQPSDEYDPEWSMGGVRQQTRMMLRVAYRLATSLQKPYIDHNDILPPPVTRK